MGADSTKPVVERFGQIEGHSNIKAFYQISVLSGYRLDNLIRMHS